MTNNPFLAVVQKSCGDAPPHRHEIVLGADDGGQPRARAAGQYAEAFCHAYAAGLRMSWRQNFAPPKLDYPFQPLEIFESLTSTPEDVKTVNATRGMSQKPTKQTSVQEQRRSAEGVAGNHGGSETNVSDPRVDGYAPPPQAVLPSAGVNARWDPTLQRCILHTSCQDTKCIGNQTVRLMPSSEGGSTDSAGLTTAAPTTTASPAPPPPRPTPTTDYWVETTNTWVLHHVEPRLKLYVPPALRAPEEGGPVADDLKEYELKGAKIVPLKDSWAEAGARALKHRWTGRTIFLKKGSPSALPGEGDMPAHIDGQAFEASSLLAADLHGMRKELKEAQRKDPALTQLISLLEKRPAGEYLVNPRSELRKVRAHVDEYTLAEDGLLLRKMEDGRALPVVPNTLYDGELKSSEAPARMTWKHLLLGSVHKAR